MLYCLGVINSSLNNTNKSLLMKHVGINFGQPTNTFYWDSHNCFSFDELHPLTITVAANNNINTILFRGRIKIDSKLNYFTIIYCNILTSGNKFNNLYGAKEDLWLLLLEWV